MTDLTSETWLLFWSTAMRLNINYCLISLLPSTPPKTVYDEHLGQRCKFNNPSISTHTDAPTDHKLGPHPAHPLSCRSYRRHTRWHIYVNNRLIVTCITVLRHPLICILDTIVTTVVTRWGDASVVWASLVPAKCIHISVFFPHSFPHVASQNSTVPWHLAHYI